MGQHIVDIVFGVMILALAEVQLLSDSYGGFRLTESRAELGYVGEEQADARDAVVGLDYVHHVFPVVAEAHLLRHAAVMPVVQEHYY